MDGDGMSTDIFTKKRNTELAITKCDSICRNAAPQYMYCLCVMLRLDMKDKEGRAV